MFKALAASLLLGSAVTMFAQLPAPIAPEQIVYRHWPEQFVQWIGPELPYTMIELYVDPAGATPLYEAVLTERATGKRVHYTNQQQMVDIDQRSGAEAYLTTMQLDRPANADKGATYLLRFVDHAGQPVSWQFIQGSDISERGGGSSPAGLDPPVLMYRELGGVAGEGTALKIGNTVSTADVWTEISHAALFCRLSWRALRERRYRCVCRRWAALDHHQCPTKPGRRRGMETEGAGWPGMHFAGTDAGRRSCDHTRH